MTIKHQVLKNSQLLARRFGGWVDRYDRQPVARRQRLIEHHAVDHVVDVGAHYGEFVDEVRSGGYVGRVTSFEPLPSARAVLLERASRDPQWSVEPWALSDRDGRHLFKVSANEVSSSLLDVQSTHVDAAPESRVQAEIEVEVRRLEDLDASIDGTSLYLKVDVQGAELDVLRGAATVLPRISLLELELSTTELYDGQQTLIGMLQAVLELGYVLVYPIPGFTDPQSGHCLQLNGIFARC